MSNTASHLWSSITTRAKSVWDRISGQRYEDMRSYADELAGDICDFLWQHSLQNQHTFAATEVIYKAVPQDISLAQANRNGRPVICAFISNLHEAYRHLEGPCMCLQVPRKNINSLFMFLPSGDVREVDQVQHQQTTYPVSQLSVRLKFLLSCDVADVRLTRRLRLVKTN